MPVTVLSETPDLFVLKEDFPAGSVEDEFGPSFFILLRNFDHNTTRLKAEHATELRDRVVPFVKNNIGFAEIYGMTDRSGSRQVNYKVAASRLREVQGQMLRLGAPSNKVNHRFAKAIGEDFFEARQAADPNSQVFRDGARLGDLRLVVIGLSPAPIGVPTRRFRSSTALNTLAFCRLHEQRQGN